MLSVGSPAGTTVATYVYNALGQRVERSGSGVPSSPLYEVYDAFGNLAFVTNNGTTGESLIGLGGRNFAKYTPSGTFFLHGDALGSTFYATDWTGQNWPQAALYDPWGQQWVMWTGGYGTIDDRYAGMQERDAESGLDPTPYRMYASSYGRWLSPDPIAGDPSNPQSWNRYAYVANNPATSIDPLGLDPCTSSNTGPGGSYACSPQQAAQSNEAPGGGGSVSGGLPIADLDEFVADQANGWKMYYVGIIDISQPAGPEGEIPFYPTAWDEWYAVAASPVNLAQIGQLQQMAARANGLVVRINAAASASDCVSDFYNTTAGQAVQFLSPLSLVPGWNSNRGQNVGEWAVAIGAKGSSLSYVGTGETLQTLNGAANISSIPELGVGWILGKAETLGPPAAALAATADALAHGVCRAVGQGGLANPFGN